MQSETFKLLMEKQKTKSNEEKSEEPKSDVKEEISTPQNMSKRGAIFLRKSALSGETNNPMTTTPIPVTSKGNNLNVNSPDKFISLANSRITSHSPVKSSDANDKSKDDDSESSDSYGKLEWIQCRRNSNKLSFFRHRAPKKSIFKKIAKMDKQTLMNFTSIKAQFTATIKMPKRNNSTCRNLNNFLSSDDAVKDIRKNSVLSPEPRMHFRGLTLKVEKELPIKSLRCKELETIAERGSKSPMPPIDRLLLEKRNKSKRQPKRHISSKQQLNLLF